MNISLRILLSMFSILCLSCGQGIEYAGDGQEKFLVITSKQKHGLGNRLRALASGYALAKQSGRTLVVDWQPSSDELPVGFNSLFTNKVLTPENQGLDLGRAKKIDVNSLGKDGLVTIKFNNKDRARIIQIESYFRFINKRLSFDDIKSDYVNFLKSLSPVDEVREAVAKFSSELLLENRKYIGVHFRSFALSSDSGYKAKNPIDVRRSAMLSAMEEATKDSHMRFFVATDDPEMLSLTKQKFGSQIISRERPVDRSTLSGMLEALVDWYLLAQSTQVIGTIDSSFSDEAALLTQTGQKVGIGPGFFHD